MNTISTKQSKCLITIPVLNLHEECSEDSPFVSQGIYGHSATILGKIDDKWAKIQTEDGYEGYGKLNGLTPDNPGYRTSRRLVQVSSVVGMVYPTPDTEGPPFLNLPFGSRVKLLKEINTSTQRFVEVELLSGKRGWMQRGDLKKPALKTLKEMIELSHQFLELPYIWGGTSSEGFDCSGFIQTLCKQLGVLLPRDSLPQSSSKKLRVIEKPKNPGDIVFFGKEKVDHVGLYLGSGKIIHSSQRAGGHKTEISVIEETGYRIQAARRIKENAFHATISPITDAIRTKMTHSWQNDNPVAVENLRYIALNHWGFDGCVHEGELIVHEKVVDEVIEIFKELFQKKYPIEKMLLIDEYLADDDLSCEDNNSSCFCSRPITGSTTEWSLHSYGLAIDINPLLNPYHNKAWRDEGIIGEEFLDRSLDCYGIIDENDDAYKAFTSRGWKWGGHWAEERGYVDYHHFYTEITITLS